MDIHGNPPLLQVFDMPTSIRFYREILGFTVWSHVSAWRRLQLGRLRLNGGGGDAEHCL